VVDRQLRVLLGCECSGRVRDEFAKLGWEAWSADLLQSETPCDVRLPDGSGYWLDILPWEDEPYGHHYMGDVRDLFKWSHPVNYDRQSLSLESELCGKGALPLWDATILFPPCTDLSYAGACWFPQKIADGRQQAAMDFFRGMVNAPSPLVCVENPRGVPMKQYRQPDQLIHPWMFGQNFKKTTCLWLKGLPPLVPDVTEEPDALQIVVSGGSRAKGLKWQEDWNTYEDSEGRKNRSKVRSRTFEGIAKAMATQWDKFAREYYA
jgi:hypothetical protein